MDSKINFSTSKKWKDNDMVKKCIIILKYKGKTANVRIQLEKCLLCKHGHLSLIITVHGDQLAVLD